ncbi:MAG: EAL domain-containing protein [Asticcacaulis sp.]
MTLFRVPSDDPDLIQAQFRALTRQIPLLHFILAVNTLAVIYTYSRLAPLWLSVFLPVVLCGVGASRGLYWWRHRHIEVSNEQALASLRRVNTTTPLLAVFFTLWGLTLYGYGQGDAHAQGQVAFYMGVTMIGCIFSLMHLRSAAIVVTLIVNIPFVAYFLFQGGTAEKAIAINGLLVSAAMIDILYTHYKDFADLVRSRRDLMSRQAETQALSDENYRMASLDMLTSLPNRRRFFSDLEAACVANAQGDIHVSVGVIDLDGFKPVNDTYGHSAGDRVLVGAAERLARIGAAFDKANARLYRLGGDEFGLIVTGVASAETLSELGGRMTDAIRIPFAIGSNHAQMACSIGIATWPTEDRTPESLYECADYALYYAKRNLRGQTVLFDERHQAEIRAQNSVERHLISADLETELTQQFQPIIDMTSGEVLCFEALARWRNPHIGAVMPDVFIPVAERTGLIGSVTRILLEKALNEMKGWPATVGLSFNLSAHDICAAEGVVRLIAIINASGIDPRRIDFEITETAMAFDFVRARQSMLALKALGCQLSLDDFGTGYSSLSYVHRLPLDRIKVDRSFVSDIDNNATSSKIVRSLAGLCSDMGLKSVIEGVETPDQLDKLRPMGFDMVQGYYFARPMAPEDIPAYLGLDKPEQGTRGRQAL